MGAKRSDRIATLEARLEEFASRLEALESGGPARRPASRKSAAVEKLEWVRELEERRGRRYHRRGMGGALVYAGSAQLGERQYRWIREHPLPDLMEREHDPVARVLSAMANPVRLRLLGALLEAPRTGKELQELLGLGSAGQLYHHLKELLAASVITQPRRSMYQVAGARVVPLLAVLAAAFDLTGEAGVDS